MPSAVAEMEITAAPAGIATAEALMVSEEPPVITRGN